MIPKKDRPLIIGITGALGSGKSTASSFFSKNGFSDIDLSSFLEEEIHTRGISKITRKVIDDVENEWQNKYGKGILAEKAIKVLGKGKLFVVDGIKNIEEVEVLRKEGNFLLLAIVSEKKERIERIKGVNKKEMNQELFKQVDCEVVCTKIADKFVENNGTLMEFVEKLQKVSKEII
ncbi:MAG TPA: AAA family ATPase [Patescibacteria group bacterium]